MYSANCLKIALIANTSWYLYNFRLNLAKELIRKGYNVVAIAPLDEHSQRLEDEGVRHRHLSLEGASINPFRELATIFSLRRILQAEKVDIALSYTPKGNIYTGLAVVRYPIHQLANVSGLGRVFIKQSWLSYLARILYKFAFRRAAWVFFQNEDDRQIFTKSGLVDVSKSERIPGSGVDLVRFCPISDKSSDNTYPITFLLIARLLWDKGLGEFVEAARFVRAKKPSTRFQILGFLDVANPSAVSRQTINDWVEEGIVEYLGATDDIRPFLSVADCCVLPSFYREGVPRSLLEAAAMGIPVITTDATGCRDAVDNGVTGFLCFPRNSQDLANKMLQFLSMPTVERQEMGMRGRDKMTREFDEKIVIDRYTAVIGNMFCK